MQLGNPLSVAPSDLLGFTRFLTGTLDNTSAFSDTNIIALLNIEYRLIQTRILAALNYDWKENTVDGLGSGLINLTASDNSYAFPTDMIQVDRIELNYTGNTNAYVPATIVPMQSFAEGISNTTNDEAIKGSTSAPLVFIRNNTFYLDPIPTTTVTSGMKVWGQTLITDLVSGTPSGEPVFTDAYHPLLAYGAAHIWCDSNEMPQKASLLFQKKELLFKQMADFYSVRNATEQPILKPKIRSMR